MSALDPLAAHAGVQEAEAALDEARARLDQAKGERDAAFAGAGWQRFAVLGHAAGSGVYMNTAGISLDLNGVLEVLRQESAAA